MKTVLLAIIIGLTVAACPVLYFTLGPQLNDLQLETALILIIICGASALYCFVVGELAHNNSQMDKLWSILPIAYTWVIAAKGGMSPRLVIMAVLATLWGIRLTFNFARKGAYKLKFWSGEEDYRWQVLREKKEFQPHWKWMIFNFFFICVYQNFLVLLITVPALVSMGSTAPLGWVDFMAMGLFMFFLLFETVADEQQFSFQSTKWKMIKEGKKLEELPAPFNLGFNTFGLWKHSRHPNYLGEQMIWVSFFIFSIGAGVMTFDVVPFNWSAAGALLLIVLFIGSSTFGEDITGSKYPQYAEYKKQVSRFIPWKGYRG